MSKKQLAAEMGFDPSYVSHVEARRHRPTEDFARRAEAVLASGGIIWQRFRDYDEVRHSVVGRPRPEPTIPEQWRLPTAGLVVEHEDATLSYVDGGYRCVIRRDLYNGGHEAITRYLVRIAVDRDTGIIVRLTESTRSGITRDAEVVDLEPDAVLQPTTFDFVFPTGTTMLY